WAVLRSARRRRATRRGPACLVSSFVLMSPRTPRSTLFPYTTLFRSVLVALGQHPGQRADVAQAAQVGRPAPRRLAHEPRAGGRRSEEHTSELQSPCNLVCRLLLEKKKIESADARSLAADPVHCVYDC